MRNWKLSVAVIVVLFAAGITARSLQSAAAQPAQKAPAAAPASTPAPTLSALLDKQISASEKQLVEAAEAMPEDKFNFSPASLNIPGSDYKSVRTFALQARHVATANFFFWSAITGDKLPPGIKDANGPEDLKTKAEIVKFLKDSYAVGHKAAAALTAENQMEIISVGPNKAPNLQVVTNGVAHAADHYGQMVEYLRMNGIVPPASRAQ